MSVNFLTRRGLISVAGSAFAVAAGAQTRVLFRVGMSAPANTFLAIWMAEAAGLYAGNGLAFEIVTMTGGAESGPMLSGGKIELMHIGLSSVIRANAAGADLRVVGSLSNVIRFTLFARPGVQTPAQLKDGVFAISSAGSESDVTITLALEKLGLSRADISVREVGSGGQRLAAVRAGEVTATALNEPYRTQAFEAGLTALVDLVPDQTPWIFSGLVADVGYIRTHRDAILRFLRATIEGNYLALADAARGRQILGNVLKISDAKVLDLAYNDFRAQSPLNAEISHEGALRNIALVARPGAKRDVADYVDTSFSDELRREGYFLKMQAKYAVK